MLKSLTLDRSSDMTTELPQKVQDLFKCFICYESLVKPVLCPYCSKVGCERCVKKWLIEEKSQCPHCRSPLNPSELVSFRFMDDLANQLKSFLNQTPMESCPKHIAPFYYYCHDCSEGLCADCAAFESTHRDHHFERIQNVYDQRCHSILGKLSGLKSRLAYYNGLLNDIKYDASKLIHSREKSIEQHKKLLRDCEISIRNRVAEKLELLNSSSQTIQQEKENINKTIETLESKLSSASQLHIIKNSLRITDLIEKHPTMGFTPNIPKVEPKISTDMIPDYETGECIITDFSSKISKKLSFYSSPMFASGLTWRLKVYCGGNGSSRGDYLSVFVEVISGLERDTKYQYRIEMFNNSNQCLNETTKPKCFAREFVSTFAPGDCWGYNRYHRLDTLESGGYVDPINDTLHLKFHIRALTWAQRCKDLNRYISTIKKDGSDFPTDVPQTIHERLERDIIDTTNSSEDAQDISINELEASIRQLNLDVSDLMDPTDITNNVSILDVTPIVNESFPWERSNSDTINYSSSNSSQSHSLSSNDVLDQQLDQDLIEHESYRHHLQSLKDEMNNLQVISK
ncbi:hypothetical protein BC833DRAFT_595063 [Globomyces pollinis-pini]|nr:hypothetical protein BC833DRAFT_595063 [Globomyces pollinis-pini]